MITPCDLCAGSTPKLVTYDFGRLCCAIRYLLDAPIVRREINLEMLSKHHGRDALRAALESPKEK